jgi:hypothetical protein
MTYEETLNMIANAVTRQFYRGTDYDGLKNTIVESATNIYIKQMELEKEKLQEEYNELYEGHEKLSYDWAQLKKENKELHKKYSELLEESNRNIIEYVRKKNESR